VCYVCLVGSSEDELRLSSVPGLTCPLSGGAFAPRLVIIGRYIGFRWGRSVNIVHNIRRGSSSAPSGHYGRSLTTVPNLSHLLRLGMGRAQNDIAFSPQLWLRPGGGYARVGPGMVATAARLIVATSEGGGRPYRQSRPLQQWVLLSSYTT
jgi:hypothetical protein